MIKLSMTVPKVLKIMTPIVAAVLILVAVLVFNFLKPFPYQKFINHQNTVTTYAQAVDRISQMQASEQQGIRDVGHTEFMTHGKKTEKVVVIFHGYTNSPGGAHNLGMMLFDKGYNVFIPRVLYHGNSDLMTEDLKNLNAEMLATFSDEMVDIGTGLGDSAEVMGISMGGVMTAWVAQNRSDVSKAVVIEPLLGYYGNEILTKPITNIFFLLPNWFRWWDPKVKDGVVPGIVFYAYPRYSTKGLAEIVRLGQAVLEQSKSVKPKAGSIVVVTNASDTAINNAMADRLAKRWQDRGAMVSTYMFPAELKLNHDLFDQNHPELEQTSYPILLSFL